MKTTSKLIQKCLFTFFVKALKMKVKKPRANPLKIITPMPKCLSWRNNEKMLFQSYKAVFMTQNHAKRHFLA